MFFDTSLNSRSAVLANIYTAAVETATKMWAYARCMKAAKRPGSGVVVGMNSPFSILMCPTLLGGIEVS
jgi:hypothetical protein